MSYLDAMLALRRMAVEYAKALQAQPTDHARLVAADRGLLRAAQRYSLEAKRVGDVIADEVTP